MKKLFIISAAIILGTLATWAQNALSFTIYPDAPGTFYIYYSTYKTPSTNAMQVDWGDGVLQVFNDKAETGSFPTKLISGTVTVGTPIKLYSDCIDAIWFGSKAKFLKCEANNPQLQYIYYFFDNISSANLEALYLSLYNRSSKTDWGELHISNKDLIADAGNKILKSNAFIAIDKKWHICSQKAWEGNSSARINWELNEANCNTYLIPAITLKTPQLAAMTDLQIGIMDSPELPYLVTTSQIRIVDGDGNSKKLSVSRYSTNSDFWNNAPKLTVAGTGVPYFINIYGALVSHIKSSQIRALDVTNSSNLRYLNINSSSYITTIPGLSTQEHLTELQLYLNTYLESVDVQKSTKLLNLNVNNCQRLVDLKFSPVSLESLNFAQCFTLDYYKLSSLSNASKLVYISAENVSWNTVTMNLLYKNLSSSAPSGAKIYIEEDELGGQHSNDWKCSNKTFATSNGWKVIRSYNQGSEQLLTDDGSNCNSGISEVEAAQFITLSPNPASDIVKVTIQQNLNAESLQVIDFTGKTIYTLPITSSKSEYQINVSDYSKGIHLIRVGNVTRKLFVK